MWRRVVLLVLLAAMVNGCASQPDPWLSAGNRLRIVATIPPLACFARAVGGEHVEVRSLCTVQGPHQYEYSSEDGALLKGAQAFLVNGLQLDDRFAERAQRSCGNPSLRYVNIGEHLPPNLLQKGKIEEHHAGSESEHGHQHGKFDPHIWLGHEQALAIVDLIRDAFRDLDPSHAADYDRQAARYHEQLVALHAEGIKALSKVKDRRLISFHDSLGYFAHSYDLTIADVMEEGPGDEPSGPKMAELVDICVKEKLPVIAVEPQYPKSTSADTLRRTLNSKGITLTLVEIDPLETSGDETIDGAWYLQKTRENLAALARGLPHD